VLLLLLLSGWVASLSCFTNNVVAVGKHLFGVWVLTGLLSLLSLAALVVATPLLLRHFPFFGSVS
jgi:hypothetical protein